MTMTRKERLYATLKGEPVERPAFNFYELNGLDEDPHNKDPFNIYNDSSWAELIELTRCKTDRIVMRKIDFYPAKNTEQANRSGQINPAQHSTKQAKLISGTKNLIAQLSNANVTSEYDSKGSLITTYTVQVGKRTLQSRIRRDRDVNTIWALEHLLKDEHDARAWLELPEIPEFLQEQPDINPVLQAEEALGDSGIVMIDTPDPLCLAADLFEMGTYTIIAMMEPELFHRILQRFARILHYRTEQIAQLLPGRLWRIYGPEYASPPYLPPRFFREYVVQYDKPMVESIQKYGGFARIHSHGNLKTILDDIVSTGCMGLDPVEPPPQGDVSLKYVREKYGDKLVLFGNLEASDIETLPNHQFEKKVESALNEGTAGAGRGFVLMPSGCPYGRKLNPLALQNYKTIISVIEKRYGK